ncbi:DUF3791 domain-containing protein [Anaeromicropila herbilytica]|uniref:Transcriptional regulator n=1 Tax=Anaeromicropila herbilytica TaxID=2785025 RepID=A0A7R7ENJ8_9FIRM|nr:DUF3791 domain-containing protein [Anaeromicropila herbilytica]BCN31835.1 transcriptional regulator [Anaeromicropila herbilytica]
MNQNEIEFAVFCIENIAQALQKNSKEIFELLVNESDILIDYIIPCYESLHTQSKQYIMDDIVDVMKSKGVIAC